MIKNVLFAVLITMLQITSIAILFDVYPHLFEIYVKATILVPLYVVILLILNLNIILSALTGFGLFIEFIPHVSNFTFFDHKTAIMLAIFSLIISIKLNAFKYLILKSNQSTSDRILSPVNHLHRTGESFVHRYKVRWGK